MGFRIIYNVAGSFEDFDDLAEIGWDQAAHLVVTTPDKRRTFSDHGWVCIEESPERPERPEGNETGQRSPGQRSGGGEASASW